MMPVGRPSKYKEKYCDMLIKHMSSGLSFETFAPVIKVNQDTLHEWAKVHENFSEAKKEAFYQCQLFWEKMGISGAAGKLKNFNATAYIYNVKNRFRRSETWKPIREDDVTNNFNFTLNYDPKKIEAIDDGESN